jgi:hypothetical protein
MRNLILLILGMAIGAIGAANIVNALRQRDAYPRGLMNVMQYHYVAMRGDVRLNRCAVNTPQHLAILRELAGGIETAVYAGDIPEPPFHEYDQRLRAALDAVPADTTSTDCAALAPALNRIGAACDACHRQYR